MTQKFSSVKKCHEAHQIDQQNVLNAKMYVVGAKKHFFFSRVNIDQNWPAAFRHRHFVIGGVGGAPSLYPSLVSSVQFDAVPRVSPVLVNCSAPMQPPLTRPRMRSWLSLCTSARAQT